MTDEVNLLEDFEYIGEFWFLKNRSNKFSGVLKYSASKGIEIEFVSTSKKISITSCIEKGLILLGCIEELGNTTFFPQFVSKQSLTFGDCKTIGIRESGIISCNIAIVGLHYQKESDLNFQSCSFKFNNLENFCSRDTTRERCEEDNTILSANQDGFNLTLNRVIHYTYGSNKISDLLFLKNDDIKQDIDAAVNKVLKEHKLSRLDPKTKVSYEFYLNRIDKSFCNKQDFLDFIFSIRNLFAYLMLKPLFPEIINFYKNKKSYQIIYCNYLNEKQLHSIKNKTHFFRLPVNINGIKDNFESVLDTWIKFNKWKLNLINETIFNHIFNDIDPVSHYVILVASIERWQRETKGDKPNTYYDDFIKKYANQKIKDSLLSLMPKGIKKESIGWAIHEIRNIIIHPKKLETDKFKKFKDHISRKNIANLAERIFILFIIALFEEFQLPKDLMEEIRGKFSNGIRTWE